VAIAQGDGIKSSGCLRMEYPDYNPVTHTFDNLQAHTISFWMRGKAGFSLNTAAYRTKRAVHIWSIDGLIKNLKPGTTQESHYELRADLDLWHFVELKNIDWTAQTYDYYVDHEPLLRGQPFDAAATGVTSIDFMSVEINEEAWFDELVIK